MWLVLIFLTVSSISFISLHFVFHFTPYHTFPQLIKNRCVWSSCFSLSFFSSLIFSPFTPLLSTNLSMTLSHLPSLKAGEFGLYIPHFSFHYSFPCFFIFHLVHLFQFLTFSFTSPSRLYTNAHSHGHTHLPCTHTPPHICNSLRAGVYCPHVFTRLAFHLTAPLEGTRTPLLHLHHLCVILSATTHQVTSVQADARPVALPPTGADDACVNGERKVY